MSLTNREKSAQTVKKSAPDREKIGTKNPPFFSPLVFHRLRLLDFRAPKGGCCDHGIVFNTIHTIGPKDQNISIAAFGVENFERSIVDSGGGGLKRGGVSDLGFFCSFLSPLPDFSEIFPIFGGIFPICPFPLSRPIDLIKAPTKNIPGRVRDTIRTFPEKSG